jgi:hypothetical protein
MSSVKSTSVLGKGLSLVCTEGIVLEALDARHFMDRYNTGV